MPSKHKVHSNYWKIANIEDYNEKDTSSYHHFSTPSNVSFSRENDTLAIASNHSSENLKIYQLYPTTPSAFSRHSLIHLASISLPDIHKLKFLNSTTSSIDTSPDFKFLLSGHSNGIVHLSAIPLRENPVFENAEIIKRFNHGKHLSQSNFHQNSFNLLLNNGKLSTSISCIELSPSSWKSASFNSMLSIYNHNLFFWDTSRSRAPLSFIRINGISNLAPNHSIDSLTAVVGDFGLSLIDLRSPEKRSTPYSINEGFSQVTWNNENENQLATLNPHSNNIFLWDIRSTNKSTPLATLHSNPDRITDMKWLDGNLWASDDDGTLTKWDLHMLDSSNDLHCTIQGSPGSISNLNMQECGSSIRISNEKLISIQLENCLDNSDHQLISLDTQCLSTHRFRSLSESNKSIINKVQAHQTPPLENRNDGEHHSPLLEIPKTREQKLKQKSQLTLDSASKDDLFDDVTTNATISSPTSSTHTDTANRLISGDYVSDLQEDVNRMLEKMHKKISNNIVYI